MKYFLIILLVCSCLIISSQDSDADKNKPFLGVEMIDASKKLHEHDPESKDFGAILIRRILVGSSAYNSKLKVDDLLFQIGDTRIDKSDSVQSVIACIKKYKPGDEVVFKVLRISEEYRLNERVYDSFQAVESEIKKFEKSGLAYSLTKKVLPKKFDYQIKLGSRSQSATRKNIYVYKPKASPSKNWVANIGIITSKIKKDHMQILSQKLLEDSQMDIPGESALVNFAQQNPLNGYVVLADIEKMMMGNWMDHLSLFELFDLKPIKNTEKKLEPLLLNDLLQLFVDKKDYEEMYFANNPNSSKIIQSLKGHYFDLKVDTVLDDRDLFQLLVEDEKLKLDQAFMDFFCNFYANMEMKLLSAIVASNTQNKVMRIEQGSIVILIGTKGDDIYQQSADLIIDPGGNDRYLFQAGVKMPVIIDFTGDDSYISYRTGGIAADEGMISLIKDYAGNDTYKGKDWSIAVGLNGIGILEDFSGDDLYEVDAVGLGVGLRGFGVLLDHKGDDRYLSGYLSIGVGLYRGLGLVKDSGGNDFYKCHGYLNSSYKEDNILDSLGIGFGFGVRGLCRGGVGVVEDLEGDDVYSGGNFCAGTGYYYGTGVLYDKKGNDSYQVSRYALGSAAHSALGLFCDTMGNDQYETNVHGICGAAWDLSCAYFIDEAGNDIYQSLNAFSFGAADQSAFSIHLDLSGDDTYKNSFYTNAANNYHNGKSVGLLLNNQGKDVYPEGFKDQFEEIFECFYFIDK